jgi:hypothetical protein
MAFGERFSRERGTGLETPESQESVGKESEQEEERVNTACSLPFFLSRVISSHKNTTL